MEKVKISETFPKFREAILALSAGSLSSVPEKVLKGQCRQFLKRLELSSSYTTVQLKNVDPRELITFFENPVDTLYEGKRHGNADYYCMLCQSAMQFESGVKVSMHEYRFDGTKSWEKKL